jgi:hypothetical protein
MRRSRNDSSRLGAADGELLLLVLGAILGAAILAALVVIAFDATRWLRTGEWQSCVISDALVWARVGSGFVSDVRSTMLRQALVWVLELPLALVFAACAAALAMAVQLLARRS